MSEVWLTVGALAVTTALIRASGPVLLGERELHPRAFAVIGLLAPALLAALVITETFSGEGRTLTVDARAAGVAAAGGALAIRDSVLLAIAVAVAVTAGVRALG